MQWKIKPSPAYHSSRWVKKFAFWPVQVLFDKEFRWVWLESFWVRQMYEGRGWRTRLGKYSKPEEHS